MLSFWYCSRMTLCDRHLTVRKASSCVSVSDKLPLGRVMWWREMKVSVSSYYQLRHSSQSHSLPEIVSPKSSTWNYFSLPYSVCWVGISFRLIYIRISMFFFSFFTLLICCQKQMVTHILIWLNSTLCLQNTRCKIVHWLFKHSINSSHIEVSEIIFLVCNTGLLFCSFTVTVLYC